MEHTAQDLRDLLSLARMLRRFAQDHDAHQDLFLETASALEERAFAIALTNHLPEAEQRHARDPVRYASVDLLI